LRFWASSATIFQKKSACFTILENFCQLGNTYEKSFWLSKESKMTLALLQTEGKLQ
jgi:hypothetical protein